MNLQTIVELVAINLQRRARNLDMKMPIGTSLRKLLTKLELLTPAANPTDAELRSMVAKAVTFPDEKFIAVGLFVHKKEQIEP